MAKICVVCSKRAYSDYCAAHKPRKPLPRASIKKRVKVPTKKKPKAKTRSYYVKELDRVFSIYIRRRDDGKGCITCGVVKPWQEMQNGHYESRGKLPTRWDERNCHSQCMACNLFKKGNYTMYAIEMLRLYGDGILYELQEKANSSEKIPTSVIKDKIEEYKEKIANYS